MRYTVSVKPGSKAEKLEISGDKILIRTPKRAHDGEANDAVIKILAKHFHVAKGNISILKGKTSREKLVEVIEKSV